MLGEWRDLLNESRKFKGSEMRLRRQQSIKSIYKGIEKCMNWQTDLDYDKIERQRIFESALKTLKRKGVSTHSNGFEKKC